MAWALVIVLSLFSYPSHSSDPHVLYTEYPVLPDATGVIRLSRRAVGDGQLLERVLAKASSRTYEQFLKELRTEESRLFRNHVLLFHSQSLQASSPEHPRVILFNEGTFLALREDPNRDEREVEVLAWVPAESRFRTAEIRFADRTRANGRVERDPPSCIACHGEARKPIWLPYDFWPGAYGANISRTLSRAESIAYREFLRQSEQAPDASVEKHLNFELTVKGGGEFDYQLPAVELLTELVQQLHLAARRSEILSGDARWKQLIPALIAPAQSCLFTPSGLDHSSGRDADKMIQRINAFVGQDVLTPEVYITRLEKNDQDTKIEKQKLLARYVRQFNPSPGNALPYMPERLSQGESLFAVIRQLFLEIVGLPATSFGFSPFERLDRFTSPLQAELAFSALVGTTPEILGPAFVTGIFDLGDVLHYSFPAPRFDCDRIERESVERLRTIALHAPGPLARPIAITAPLPQCASCHANPTEDSLAPLIPFDEPVELADWLRAPERRLRTKIEDRLSRSGRGRMPHAHPLTETEKTSVLQALDRIARIAE